MTEKMKREDISTYQLWKWRLEDMTGLYIHGFIARLSRDKEVKNLYQEMREALLQEGNQPKAVQLSNQIRVKITQNTIERLPA